MILNADSSVEKCFKLTPSIITFLESVHEKIINSMQATPNDIIVNYVIEDEKFIEWQHELDKFIIDLSIDDNFTGSLISVGENWSMVKKTDFKATVRKPEIEKKGKKDVFLEEIEGFQII